MNANKVHKQGLESDYIGLGPQISAKPIQLDLSMLLGPDYENSELGQVMHSEEIEEIKVNEVVEEELDPYIDPFEPIFESLNITPISVEKLPDGLIVDTIFHKDSVKSVIIEKEDPTIKAMPIHGFD